MQKAHVCVYVCVFKSIDVFFFKSMSCIHCFIDLHCLATFLRHLTTHRCLVTLLPAQEAGLAV